MKKVFRDLTNKTLGQLTILREEPPRFQDIKSRPGMKLLKRYWLCRCSCGEEKVVRGDSLGREKSPTLSCGCLQKRKTKEMVQQRTLPPGEKPFNDLFCNYRRRAREMGIEFSLDKKLFFSLTQGNCSYCNRVPHQIIRDSRFKNNHFIYNGIDRIDSGKGYLSSNCQSCCGDCNYAKGSLSEKEFLDLITKIFYHRANETCTISQNPKLTTD